MLEPRATAIALLVVGIVLAACVLSTRLAARTGVPVFLLFVVLGLVAGEEGLPVVRSGRRSRSVPRAGRTHGHPGR